MALGTREISRYCAPADEATGCNQCDLNAQEQCKQTFYLKQQNEILKSETQTDSTASASSPIPSTTTVIMSTSSVDETKFGIPSNSNAEVVTSLFFVGGLVLGFILCIVFLKIAKRL